MSERVLIVGARKITVRKSSARGGRRCFMTIRRQLIGLPARYWRLAAAPSHSVPQEAQLAMRKSSISQASLLIKKEIYPRTVTCLCFGPSNVQDSSLCWSLPSRTRLTIKTLSFRVSYNLLFQSADIHFGRDLL